MKKSIVLLPGLLAICCFIHAASGHDDEGWEAVSRPAGGAGRGRREVADHDVVALSQATEGLTLCAPARIEIVDPSGISPREQQCAKRKIVALSELERCRMLKVGCLPAPESVMLRNVHFDRLLGSYLLVYHGSFLIGYIKYDHPIGMDGRDLVGLKKEVCLTEKQIKQIDCKTLAITLVVHPDYSRRGIYEMLLRALVKKYPRAEKLRIEVLAGDSAMCEAVMRFGIRLRFDRSTAITVTIPAAQVLRPAWTRKSFFSVEVIKGDRDNETVYLLIDGDSIVGAMNVVHSSEGGFHFCTTSGPSVFHEYSDKGVYELLLDVLAEEVLQEYYSPHIRISDMDITNPLNKSIFEQYLKKAGFCEEAGRVDTFIAAAKHVRKNLGYADVPCIVKYK